MTVARTGAAKIIEVDGPTLSKVLENMATVTKRLEEDNRHFSISIHQWPDNNGLSGFHATITYDYFLGKWEEVNDINPKETVAVVEVIP